MVRLAPPPSPGDYLRRRRTCSGLSLHAAAAAIVVLPWAIRPASDLEAKRMALRLATAEEGGEPFSYPQLQLIASVIPIDPDIYQQLHALQLAGPRSGLPVPQLCRVCACSFFTPCGSHRAGFCHWVAPDLCSACGTAGQSRRIRAEEAILGGER